MNDTERPEPAADAVIFTCTNPECDACEAERDPFPDMTADAVHAVHEALVNSAPGWIIDREDGELLDMARAALQAAIAAAKGTEGSE